MKSVDFAADGKKPDDHSGHQGSRSQRNGRQPRRPAIALKDPPGRDDDGGKRHNAVHHRSRDDRHILGAEAGRAGQRGFHPPEQIEQDRQCRKGYRRVADDSGRQQPLPEAVVVRCGAGERGLGTYQCPAQPEPRTRADAARHIGAAAVSHRLHDIERHKAQHQQHVRGVEPQP
jgi:hypothetical protein